MSMSDSTGAMLPEPPLQPDDPVHRLSGIGEKRALLLKALGIETIEDLLFHLPREYQDRSLIRQIAEAKEGEKITVAGEIVSARSLRLRGGKTTALLEIDDGTGRLKVSLFGRGFLVNSSLVKGTRCIFTGTVGEYKGLTLQNPEYEVLAEEEEGDPLNTGRIVPVYGLTAGITQRLLRRWIRTALDAIGAGTEESLPEQLRKKHALMPLADALAEVHFPGSLDGAQAARRRLVYEELLVMQCAILQRRALQEAEVQGIAHRTDGPLLQRLRAELPFTLTDGQQHAVKAIFDDMRAKRPMFRLVQGDVGCGKTLVALHALTAAVDSGVQVAFMAPTEILAEQHYATLSPRLTPLGIEVALLTASTPRAAQLRERIERGEVPVVIGTHALVQPSTRFHKLGLVIIDEQHRFGVGQRDELMRKGDCPDILHLTATPIPRTLALTLYGGMDITLIPDMPPGRLPVKTTVIPETRKEELYAYLCGQAAEGWQSYIVCPLVEESEHFASLTPLIDHYTALTEGALAEVRCAMLHGRMDPREKEEVMTAFKNREISILFSTTVIEVGVDSPAATTMVIEDAGRFGLAQLHQLRGRVGRGNKQSYCFLLGAPTTPEGRQRIKLLCETTDGFQIAEADLALRGPGDYCGARQSGLPDFRAADLLQDIQLLEEAREDAEALLKADPALNLREHAALKEKMMRHTAIFI